MMSDADAPQSLSASSENGQNTGQRQQSAVQPLNGSRRMLPPHPVIDCDIHNEVSSIEVLMPYLADYWRDYVRESAFRGPHANDYPRGAPTSARPGSMPAEGGAAGSSLQLVREQALDPWNTEIGILNCAYRVQSVKQEDLAADLATAANRWQIDEWLAPEPRLRASLVVPSRTPPRAAEEIHRFGDHRQFVQVVLPVRSFIRTATVFMILYMPLLWNAIWLLASISGARPATRRRLWAGLRPIWKSMPAWRRYSSPKSSAS